MAVEPIAIVGLSCRLPGGANDLESLWKVVGYGREAWSPVPSDRFNEAAFHHPHADNPHGTNNHRGGHFIDGDIRDFDHAFFHLSPPVAAAMDPQQRILLELAYEALDSAGWPREKLAGSRTAVYAAIFGYDYERILCKDVLDMPVYQSVGTGIAILANRISHAFDFRGPSVTIDTGCSGGLVALHQACQSLRNGESDIGLVASANLQIMPDHYVGMSMQHMVSGSGRCHPFDIRGDGYGRGEGFVVVLVKRLKDALRDGDPVRAVLLNTGVNQDGFTSSGITHPNSVAQADLIRETYARIGLRPQDIAYVEAHGTGTVAGDQEELGAIADVFATPNRSIPLYVGSNKGSIGHTESTSGLASLLKALCISEHGIIPPVAGFASPKPGLPLDRLRIPTERLLWPEDVAPRISINSFGYGGTNAHAIIEKRSPMRAESVHVDHSPASRLFLLSAHKSSSLKTMVESYANWLEQNPVTSLADLSHTLCRGRSALPWRLSCVADTCSSLVRELRQSQHKVPSKPNPIARHIIFVFTGQGAQWAGMGRELILEAHSAVFRDSIRKSRNILHRLGATWDLETELLRNDSESNINRAEYAQPATTAIQIALVDLLRAQGVEPSTVVGHSSGEIGTAYAADLLSHETALRVAFHRGFMATAVKGRGLSQGAMASVGLGADGVAPYLRELSTGEVVLACVNSPSSVTVSGDAQAIDEVLARIDSADPSVFKRKLRTDTAYHSHHMSAVAKEYRSRLGDLDLNVGSSRDVTFVSSVTGSRRSSGFDASYWVDNLVSRVNFLEAVQTIAKSHHEKGGGHAVFIEIGPHAALAGPVRQCLAAQALPSIEYDYVSVLQRGVNAISSTLALAGRLFERGVQVNYDEVLSLTSGSGTAAILTDLPRYPWDHSVKHWHESRLSREYRMRREPYHDLLGVRMTDSTAIEPRWRHMVGLNTLPWLADHVIDGLAIFPGAGYVCMAAEAVMQLAREQGLELDCLAFRDISFLRGLVVPDAPQRIEMQLTLRRQSSGDQLDYAFTVAALADGSWKEQCIGFVKAMLSSESDHSIGGTLMPSSTQLTAIDGDELDVQRLYTEMASDGNTYGETFRGLRSIMMQPDGLVATAVVEVPDVAAVMPANHQAPHLLHPTTFDSMFHVGIPMIKQQQGAGSVMPVHIGELLVSTKLPALSNPGSNLDVAAKITSNQFRATHIDMSATADGHTVLSASGIESRSLAAHAEENGGTCYELEWKTDLEFIRARDLSHTPALADIISCLCFKKADLAFIELKAGRGGLAATVLAAVEAHNGKVATFELTDVTSELFDYARQSLSGHPVSYRVLQPESDIESQGFQLHQYDVVLTSDMTALGRIPDLLKPDGILVLVLEPDTPESSWQTALSEASPILEIQLAFSDAMNGKSIVIARTSSVSPHPHLNSMQIFTHSMPQDTPSWVSSLQAGLSALGITSSLNTLSEEVPKKNDDDNANDAMIIIDDLPQPILDDEKLFDVAITLLRQRRRILWLSLDQPLPMHQITGVSRTAHAENDHLRLTTVHVAPAAFGHPRLADVVRNLLGRLTDQTTPLHYEREYLVREDVSVLIPRLHRSDRLNLAISTAKPIDHVDIEVKPFKNEAQPMSLQTSSDSRDNDATFVPVQAEDIGSYDIEIETQAFVLPKTSDSSRALGVYAGIVRSVGTMVDQFVPGDAVVALSLDGAIGHSRPPIYHSRASRYPEGLSPAEAAALFVPLQAAAHALQNLARPRRGAAILIHGGLSEIGCATLAVARSLELGAVVTAVDLEEADKLRQIFGVQDEEIFLSSPHLNHPRYKGKLRWEAVIVAEDTPFPVASLDFLEPFGHVISLCPSADLGFTSKLPRNASLHNCDISVVLSARPNVIDDLVRSAECAFPHVTLTGLHPVVRNVSHTKEAMRQLNMGRNEKVVIEVTPGSLVRAALPSPADDKWMSQDAAYVVAGGMGDLGRRFLFLLARRGAMHLVTLSRRATSPEEQMALESRLQEVRTGCRLYCLQCDVTSEVDVHNAARSLKEMGVPPVRGVIQSAVFLQDRTLETMTFESFKPVTLAKIQGTLNLEEAFATEHLDFFLMLSSAVVVTGASGQANYNAGNAVQDAIAHHRRPGFISLNIGWIEDAIHTANDRTKLQGLWRTGLTPIAPQELLRYFDYLLGAASGHSRVRQAVIGFNEASLSHTSAGNSNVQSALFCHVRNFHKGSETSPSATRPKSLREIVESASLDTVVNFIAQAIIGQLSTLISVDASQIDADNGSIISLGLDSLVAIELRNWITREFEASLQSSEILTDQPVRALAQKVASRSRIVLARKEVDGEEKYESSDNGTDESLRYTNSTSTLTSTGSSDDGILSKFKSSGIQLPPLPLPSLENILGLFEESRLAIDPDDDRSATSAAVRKFLDGSGPELYRQVQQTEASDIADAYERQVYLERREPLPETGQFTFIHPIRAPTHSQAERAAIITVAAIDYARRLARNEIPPDMLHGEPLSAEGRDWLFYTTRRPEVRVDRMERFEPNHTIAVLRRGHVFQVDLPATEPLGIGAVCATYSEILKLSDDPVLSVCTLTADERDSWAKYRHHLEQETSNAATLACIDRAAFVLCLDDESPSTAGERYTQFLLNGAERPFANRWLDKTLQLIVTANGLSGETYEHTKLDGLDARGLHSHLCQAVLSHTGHNSTPPTETKPYHVLKHKWSRSRSVSERISHVMAQRRSYGPLEYATVDIPRLGLDSLRGTRSPPNATAHMAVLLGLSIVDGEIRPAWEKVTQGTFARGRVEWVQTMTSAARNFVTAATTGEEDARGEQLRKLLDEATSSHSRLIAAASRGRGAVGPLYALRAVAAAALSGEEVNMPELFQTRAWDATRRGGPGQDVKIGFMRFDDGQHTAAEAEAGFLVPGDRGVYVHCNVQETHARFSVSGKTAYVVRVCEALRRAAEMVAAVLE
ncbi:polyketide synthase [Xylariaceae sp. FL0594]|nr:polyketide synthase [Xylariaceae sp. FL0594]